MLIRGLFSCESRGLFRPPYNLPAKVPIARLGKAEPISQTDLPLHVSLVIGPADATR
jgi:hypothetical protein